MQHLQHNTTLQGGKYRIERVLGQGGFGITYLARNTVLGMNVAIKEFFLKDENIRNGNTVITTNTTKLSLFLSQKEKFKKEAKRMFAIKNEHIVIVKDFFEENGTAYYVMDYVDGENLSHRLRRLGQPLDEPAVWKILYQILDALNAVHEANIWHLDLKPANIMIDKGGSIKLIDFGASKQLDAQKGGATTSTAICYTIGYAPLEQMEQNYYKFGPWTDLYALGATLYNLLTYRHPPLPSNIDDDLSADKHEALPMPASVSVGMRNLILWLMQTNRNKRPKTVNEVREGIEKTILDPPKNDGGKKVPENPPYGGNRSESKGNSGGNSLIIILILAFLVLAGWGIVKCSKDGNTAYYGPNPDGVVEVVDTSATDIPEVNYKTSPFYLTGFIGSLPITMYLRITNNAKVSGWYYYNKKGPDNKLTLSGSLYTDGRIILNESDEYGNHTGMFEGAYKNDGTYKGTFHVIGNSKNYKFYLNETSDVGWGNYDDVDENTDCGY